MQLVPSTIKGDLLQSSQLQNGIEVHYTICKMTLLLVVTVRAQMRGTGNPVNSTKPQSYRRWGVWLDLVPCYVLFSPTFFWHWVNQFRPLFHFLASKFKKISRCWNPHLISTHTYALNVLLTCLRRTSGLGSKMRFSEGEWDSAEKDTRLWLQAVILEPQAWAFYLQHHMMEIK